MPGSRRRAPSASRREAERTAPGRERELLCPGCGREHPPSERFCAACGMPLVYPERVEERVDESRRRARKIDPQYTEGKLVAVARAANLAQAEFLAGLLLEEGIPSMLRPDGGIVAPYAPALGSRAVLVHESALQAAREALSWHGDD